LKYKIFVGFIVLEAAILAFLLIGALLSADKMRPEIAAKRQLVKRLMLTDLALWTESRYTRHPSQADFFTPFQDFPGAIEHFPAGSIVAPPVMERFMNKSNKSAAFSGE
jgi:hypothetical protein